MMCFFNLYMGCDIHIFIEKLDDCTTGKYKFLTKFNTNRVYAMFTLLSHVRSYNWCCVQMGCSDAYNNSDKSSFSKEVIDIFKEWGCDFHSKGILNKNIIDMYEHWDDEIEYYDSKITLKQLVGMFENYKQLFELLQQNPNYRAVIAYDN